jgi:hypothetical protein
MVTYFNRKDLVSFGSYLLSEKRKAIISDENMDNVTHADIHNWIDSLDWEYRPK